MTDQTFIQGHQEYIQKKVNPVLESMVTSVLLERPPDLVPYMIRWLTEQSGQGPTGEVTAQEYDALKKDLVFWEGKLKEIEAKAGASAEPEEDAEESEEEDDDDVDDADLPPPPANYKNAGPRQSVSAAAYGQFNVMQTEFKAPVYEKSPEQIDRIKKVLSGSFLFSTLEEKDTLTVVMAMQETKADADKTLINQGEEGGFLYVIEEGKLECFKKDKNDKEEGLGKMVKECGPGDAFGELALMYNAPRAASVKSTVASLMWKLDRETFTNIVLTATTKKREKYCEFLKGIAILQTMEEGERDKVGDALTSETHASGTEIVRQGDPGDKFYILEDGECIVKKSYIEGQVPQDVMNYKRGDYFGELALLHNEPRAATVIAKTEVKLVVLTRANFRRLLGPLEDVLKRNIGTLYT